MLDAELDKQRINGSYLNAMTATGVPDLGGFNMVFAIWLEKTKRRKPFNQLAPGFCAGKTLEQFLEHESCSEDLIRSLKCMQKRFDFGPRCFTIASEGQRPDAGIYKQTHGRRARSAL